MGKVVHCSKGDNYHKPEPVFKLVTDKTRKRWAKHGAFPSVILVLERLRQENVHECEVSLCHIMRICGGKKIKTKTKKGVIPACGK